MRRKDAQAEEERNGEFHSRSCCTGSVLRRYEEYWKASRMRAQDGWKVGEFRDKSEQFRLDWRVARGSLLIKYIMLRYGRLKQYLDPIANMLYRKGWYMSKEARDEPQLCDTAWYFIYWTQVNPRYRVRTTGQTKIQLSFFSYFNLVYSQFPLSSIIVIVVSPEWLPSVQYIHICNRYHFPRFILTFCNEVNRIELIGLKTMRWYKGWQFTFGTRSTQPHSTELRDEYTSFHF